MGQIEENKKIESGLAGGFSVPEGEKQEVGREVEKPWETGKERIPDIRTENKEGPQGFGLAQTQPVKKAGLTTPGDEQVRIKAVEAILESNLAGVFQLMSPQEQAVFKAKGEATAQGIARLLHEVRVKVKKITKLILSWLKLIPNVSPYFIEQESKIKTDKLLELRARQTKGMD